MILTDLAGGEGLILHRGYSKHILNPTDRAGFFLYEAC